MINGENVLRIMVLGESDLIKSAIGKDLATLQRCDVRVNMSELSKHDIVIYTPPTLQPPYYKVLKNRFNTELADRIANMVLLSTGADNKNREEHNGSF